MTKENIDVSGINKNDIIETTLGDIKSFIDDLVSKYGADHYVEFCDDSSGGYMTIFRANIRDWARYHYYDEETGEEAFEYVKLLTLFFEDTL